MKYTYARSLHFSSPASAVLSSISSSDSSISTPLSRCIRLYNRSAISAAVLGTAVFCFFGSGVCRITASSFRMRIRYGPASRSVRKLTDRKAVCLAKGPGIAPKLQGSAPAPQRQVRKATGRRLASASRGRERSKRGFAATGRRCFPLFTDVVN